MSKYQAGILLIQEELKHLNQHNMLIYWSYFLLVTFFGWCGLMILTFSSLEWFFKIIIFAGTSLLFYHSSVFTHEISHLEGPKFSLFKKTWNLFMGNPFCIPVFLYELNHLVHHGNQYSQAEDSEYLPLAQTKFRGALEFLALNFVLPFLGIIRFGIIGPISFLFPKMRHLVLSKASFMGMKTSFTRHVPESSAVQRAWAMEEGTSTLILWIYFALMAIGVLPVSYLFWWTSLITTIGILNGIRALAVTHKYQFGNGGPVSYDQHIQDCVEIEKSTLGTILLCPVGTQFHMTHHMYIHIPFHHLSKARQIIKRHYPPDSFYYQNTYTGIWDGLCRLFGSQS